eukprot:4072246-Prymnesium_polylepis.1
MKLANTRANTPTSAGSPSALPAARPCSRVLSLTRHVVSFQTLTSAISVTQINIFEGHLVDEHLPQANHVIAPRALARQGAGSARGL